MRILFNDSQIRYDTGKASLIKLPHSMKTFWLPNALISVHTEHTYVGYLPRLFTPHSGTSRPISIDEIEIAFEKESAILPDISTHKPDPIKPIDTQADDDLKR